jgi:methyl-accepting chemotaxis protein
MKAFFRPAVRLMNTLKYPQKFFLVGLVLMLPLALVLSQYFVQIGNDIDFASKEKLGLQYNQPLVSYLQLVQQHAALSTAYLSGDLTLKPVLVQKEVDIDARAQEIEVVDSKLGKTLATTEKWASLNASWKDLEAKILTMTVEQSQAAHTAITNNVL